LIISSLQKQAPVGKKSEGWFFFCLELISLITLLFYSDLHHKHINLIEDLHKKYGLHPMPDGG